MQAKRKKKLQTDVLRLEERFTAAQAVDLHGKLLRLLETRHPITLDLENVADCDTAAVQVLIAARRSFAAAEVEFRLENISESVARAVRRIALTPDHEPALFAGKEA